MSDTIANTLLCKAEACDFLVKDLLEEEDEEDEEEDEEVFLDVFDLFDLFDFFDKDRLCDGGRLILPDFQSSSLCLFSRICTILYTASSISRFAMLSALSSSARPCGKRSVDVPVKCLP